ncbi:kanadaptin-like protein [Leptotrombidium deliense]|uniref:Kanadaptin-like protein n=1 Tax=Leptotrombidium deliense TaxID=299467 RepID=A0A443SSH6_9ACAR|nr:kanadaptin-like protein [Leptotrombidium deliense]
MQVSEEICDSDNSSLQTTQTCAENGGFNMQPLTSLSPVKNTFYVEVIKNGVVLITKDVNKSVITFGRSRECDFPLDHPSISRFHCALFWKEDQQNSKSLGFFYLMDLNSTHGTFLNKEKLNPNKLLMVNPGNNVFKLGGSSRVFMLGTKANVDTNDDVESGCNENKADFCSWGILDDESEENEKEDPSAPLATILAHLQSDFTSTPTTNNNVYQENPQKALQQWFEREGYEYEYKINCVNGKFKCTFQLSIEDQDVAVEGKLFLKKKDSINDACLRCCQLLDKANILFPWQAQKRSTTSAKDSDFEDEVIDETGDTEKKRSRKETKTINTYESLMEQWNTISSELQSLKAKLVTMNVNQAPRTTNASCTSEDATTDVLDSYMNTLQSVPYNINSKIEKSKLKMKISELEKRQKRTERLLKISKPNKCLENVTKSVDSERLKLSTVPKSEIREKINTILQRKTLEKDASEQKEPEKPEKKVSKIFEDENLDFKKPSTPLRLPTEKPANSKKQCTEDRSTLNKNIKSEKKVKYNTQEAYIDWLPPDSQTGDGRTSLNDKYGY